MGGDAEAISTPFFPNMASSCEALIYSTVLLCDRLLFSNGFCVAVSDRFLLARTPLFLLPPSLLIHSLLEMVFSDLLEALVIVPHPFRVSVCQSVSVAVPALFYSLSEPDSGKALCVSLFCIRFSPPSLGWSRTVSLAFSFWWLN
jgi:hypothetical protein